MTTRFTCAATFSTRRFAVALAGAIALLAAAAGSSRAADAATPSALKAAFLFNLVKFADWNGVQPETLVLCVPRADCRDDGARDER